MLQSSSGTEAFSRNVGKVFQSQSWYQGTFISASNYTTLLLLHSVLLIGVRSSRATS